MDAGWSSLIGVNPRDLELNCNAYYDHDISTSFQASHSKPSNETQSGVDSWPNVPASTGVFMSGTLAGPYLEMAAFDMNMLAQEGDFQDNGGVGITVENEDSWCVKSVGDYDNATHFPPNAGLSAQQTLPPFTYPSLQQTSNEGSRLFSQDVPVLAAVPLSAKIQGRRPTGASQTLNSVPTQQRKTRRRRGFLARSSEKPLTRSMTSQTPSSRELPSLHKQKPHARDFAPGRRQKGALNTQAIMSPFGYTTDNDASYTYTATLREAIALVQQSIKPYSPFSRRKATDLINQVAKLVDQLDQIALEEEKYGNSSSDDDDVNQPSTTISSEDSLSNSELVNIESETDNTSISSTSCQPAVGGQSSVSVEDRQHETVHAPCLQCGIKDLYYCTREGCKYSTHSCAEWKRHEESQKHSQQERFICLECPQSPPPIGVNGNSVCEFCRTSFPTLGTNLTAHYLQCQRAQQSCTTYGRKDRLIAHLRSHHSTINASQVAATGRFTVDSKWPRQCGFCGVRFKTWDERMEHIGSHFQDGLDMSSWKLPLPQPRDFRPGLKPLPKDGDDSDDDMDDTDNRPFRRRAEIQQAASSTSSSQKKAPKEYRGDGAFYQRGQTCRPPLSPVDWDSNIDEIGSKVTDHFWKTLVADRGTIGVRAQWYSRASVALERYLNDAEEPFQIQSSPVSFEPLQRKMPRDALAKGIKINSPFVDQETESVMAGEQGLRAALHVRLPPTSHPSLSPLCEPLQSVVDDSAAHLDASTIAACELRPIRPDTLLFCTEAFGGKALQLTHSEHLTVTTTAHSVTSQTSSKLCRAPSASASDYDGVTDYSSVVSFDQSPTFATGFTSHDGKRVKTRLRKRFSPIAGATARAARAAVRSLGVCRLCPSDDNNIQWLDTPSAFTSAGVSQTPYLVFAPRLIGAWNSRSKSNAGMITRPGLVRKNSPPLGIPLAAVDEMRNEYSQYIRSIVQNDIIGYIPVAYIDQGSDLPEWLLGAICSIYSTTREKDNESGLLRRAIELHVTAVILERSLILDESQYPAQQHQYLSQPMIRKQCHDGTTTQSPYQYEVLQLYETIDQCVEVGTRAGEYFSQAMLRAQPMYHYDSTTQCHYHDQSPQSYASSNLSSPCPEGLEREVPNMHINPYYLPLGPVIGLNEAQHQRTASFHSDMFLPMLRFLGECDYGKPSTPYLFYIEAQIPKCPLPSMPMQTWPIPQQPIRIQDITPSTVLGESACLKNLRTYAAYTIRKSPPRYVKTGEWKTWARANIIEESWAQAQDDVIKQIKALGDSWRSLGEKKKAVTHYIQGQITALIDKSVSTERHGALDWSLVRLDTLFKPVSLNNGNGGRSYTVRKVSSLDFHKDTSSDSGTSREIAKLPEPDTLKTSHIQNSWRGYGTPTYELKLNELLKEQLGLELKLKELLKAPEQPRIKRLELHARFKAFERCLNPQLGPKNASTLEGSQPEYIFLVPFWTESRPLQIESRMETRTKVEVFGAGLLRTVRELIFDCSKAERREIRAMPDIVFSILFVEDEADQVENAMSHFPYFSPLGFATVKNYFPYGSEKSCPKYFNLGSGRQEHRGWNCAALYHPFEEPFSDIVYASRHGHQCWTVDEGPNILSEYVWEWFWSCCHCGFHLNMSTFIEQCPGCIRPSCNTHSGTTKRSKQSYMRRNNVTRNPM